MPIIKYGSQRLRFPDDMSEQEMGTAIQAVPKEEPESPTLDRLKAKKIMEGKPPLISDEVRREALERRYGYVAEDPFSVRTMIGNIPQNIEDIVASIGSLIAGSAVFMGKFGKNFYTDLNEFASTPKSTDYSNVAPRVKEQFEPATDLGKAIYYDWKAMFAGEVSDEIGKLPMGQVRDAIWDKVERQGIGDTLKYFIQDHPVDAMLLGTVSYRLLASGSKLTAEGVSRVVPGGHRVSLAMEEILSTRRTPIVYNVGKTPKGKPQDVKFERAYSKDPLTKYIFQESFDAVLDKFPKMKSGIAEHKAKKLINNLRNTYEDATFEERSLMHTEIFQKLDTLTKGEQAIVVPYLEGRAALIREPSDQFRAFEGWYRGLVDDIQRNLIERGKLTPEVITARMYQPLAAATGQSVEGVIAEFGNFKPVYVHHIFPKIFEDKTGIHFAETTGQRYRPSFLKRSRGAEGYSENLAEILPKWTSEYIKYKNTEAFLNDFTTKFGVKTNIRDVRVVEGGLAITSGPPAGLPIYHGGMHRIKPGGRKFDPDTGEMGVFYSENLDAAKDMASAFQGTSAGGEAIITEGYIHRLGIDKKKYLKVDEWVWSDHENKIPFDQYWTVESVKKKLMDPALKGKFTEKEVAAIHTEENVFSLLKKHGYDGVKFFDESTGGRVTGSGGHMSYMVNPKLSLESQVGKSDLKMAEFPEGPIVYSDYKIVAPDGYLQFYRGKVDFYKEVSKRMEHSTFDEAIGEALMGMVKEYTGVGKNQIVYLVPKDLVGELETFATPVFGSQKAQNVIRLVVDKPTQVWKDLVLASSPRWVKNNVMGDIIFNSMEKVGPLSYSRAFRTIYKDTIPNELLKASFANIMKYNPKLGKTAETTIGQLVAKLEGTGVVRGLAKMKDTGYAINTMFEQPFVRALYVNVARKKAVSMLKAEGLAWTEVNVLNKMRVIKADPKLSGPLIDKVKETLPVFNLIGSWERKYLRRVAPFINWYKFMAQYAAKLPAKHPFLTVGGRGLGALSEHQREEVFKEYFPFMAREIEENGIPLRLANLWPVGEPGKDMVVFFNTRGLNPFATIDSITSLELLPLMSPVITVPFEQITGRAVFGDREFRSGEEGISVTAEGKVEFRDFTKIRPPLWDHILSQLPQYSLAKQLLVPAKQFDTGSILNPDPILDPITGEYKYPIQSIEKVLNFMGIDRKTVDVRKVWDTYLRRKRTAFGRAVSKEVAKDNLSFEDIRQVFKDVLKDKELVKKIKREMELEQEKKMKGTKELLERAKGEKLEPTE